MLAMGLSWTYHRGKTKNTERSAYTAATTVILYSDPTKINAGVIRTLSTVHLKPISVRPVAICRLPTGFDKAAKQYAKARKDRTGYASA